jgi:hypothetical protein
MEFVCEIVKRRDSPPSKITVTFLDSQDSISVKGRGFLLATLHRQIFGPIQLILQCIRGYFYSGVKWSEPEPKFLHILPRNAILYPMHPVVLHGVVVLRRENFNIFISAQRTF